MVLCPYGLHDKPLRQGVSTLALVTRHRGTAVGATTHQNAMKLCASSDVPLRNKWYTISEQILDEKIKHKMTMCRINSSTFTCKGTVEMTPTPCKVQLFSFEQREVSVDVDKAILIQFIYCKIRFVQYFDSFTSQVYADLWFITSANDINVCFVLHEYTEE